MKTGKGIYITAAVFLFITALFTESLILVACGVFLILANKCKTFTRSLFAFYYCGFAVASVVAISYHIEYSVERAEQYWDFFGEIGSSLDLLFTNAKIWSHAIPTAMVFTVLGSGLLFLIAAVGSIRGAEKATKIFLNMWFVPGILVSITALLYAVYYAECYFIHEYWHGFYDLTQEEAFLDFVKKLIDIPLYFFVGRSFCYLYAADAEPVKAAAVAEAVPASAPCEISYEPISAKEKEEEKPLPLSPSAIAEVKQMKELLDAEIITREEFDLIKKELLHL